MEQGINPKKLPNIFVIAAPSATGKTTLVEMLIEKMGDKLIKGITANSRPMREGEVNGEHYYFYSKEDFEEKIKQDFFIEWANVHGKNYGLPRFELDRLLNSGKAPLLVLDIQGVKHLREKLDKNIYNKIIDIFILPPNKEEVIRRMKSRGDICQIDIQKRLETMENEMKVAGEFSYQIVNDDLDKCFQELAGVINANL